MNGQHHNSIQQHPLHRPAAALFLAQFSQRLSTLPFGSTSSPSRVSAQRSWTLPRLRTLATVLLLTIQVALFHSFMPVPQDSNTLLEEQVVMKHLNRQGFGTVWLMQQQGNLYIAEGLSAEGNPVNIYVDSHSGDILRTEPRSILN